jgi:hypothetical protein
VEEGYHEESRERTSSRKSRGEGGSKKPARKSKTKEKQEDDSIMQPMPGTGTKAGESGWYHHNGLVAYFHCSSTGVWKQVSTPVQKDEWKGVLSSSEERGKNTTIHFPRKPF